MLRTVFRPASVGATAMLIGLFLFALADARPLENRPVAFLAAQPEVGEQPVFRKEYPEEYHPILKGPAKEIPGLAIFGPDAADCVKFEPAGLRITLPLDYPKQRPGTGVVTDFGVKGDFEITLRFEMLQEPNVGLGGNPTDLRLMVVPNDQTEPDMWHKTNQNRAALARDAAGRGNLGGFLANATKWDPDVPKDKWGNAIFTKIETHTNRRIPAKAKTGQLRLIRSGTQLFFLASEDPNDDFTLIQKSEFGIKDLKNVRILASTGGPKAALDLRVADLRIRAEAFPKTSAAIPVPGVEVPPNPARTSMPWWVFLLAGVPVLVLLAVSLGAWLFLRARRQSTPAKMVAATNASSAIVFECSHCGKRLKTRADRAGSKMKCPQCGKAVVVPKPNDLEEVP